jgi:hypothetical protein
MRIVETNKVYENIVNHTSSQDINILHKLLEIEFG